MPFIDGESLDEFATGRSGFGGAEAEGPGLRGVLIVPAREQLCEQRRVDGRPTLRSVRERRHVQDVDEIGEHLRACGVQITAGPVPKTGALGPMTSHYCRDPDGNLVEVASYLSA